MGLARARGDRRARRLAPPEKAAVILLRRAGAGDLATLELEAAPDHFARAPGVPRPEPDKLRAWLAAVLEHGLVIIAERGGTYLGSVALQGPGPGPGSLRRLAVGLVLHAPAARPQ